MTPYEIDVLLWYYCRVVDHPDINRRPPVWRETIDAFVDADLLVCADLDGVCYVLTERGHVYCDALKRVPLPEKSWSITWPTTEGE